MEFNVPWGNATSSLRWNHLFNDKLFLNTTAVFTDYNFADDGIILEWLPQMDAMILRGCSISTLEAVVMGLPVIRLVPDNTFSFDSFGGADYPLEPVNTIAEIKKQLKIIEHLLVQDSDTFSKIGEQILPKYFSKPTDINLKHFL